MSVPLFRPASDRKAEVAAGRLADYCSWFADQPDAPPTVPLRARVRRPLPLGLSHLLGLRPIAMGLVPGVRGWIVRWHETDRVGSPIEVGYLVTPSGRTFLLGCQNTAMFSDRHGFPPQPNPVSPAHAAQILEGLGAMVAAGQFGNAAAIP